jgi:tricorn protease
MVSIPPGRFFGLEGKWIIENHGVDPDIQLVNDPGSMVRGEDPQLERAIDEVKKAMADNPPPEPKIPPLPSEMKKKK